MIKRKTWGQTAKRGAPPHTRTALVVSAGGAKGAFAVGAIRSIYRRFRSTGWFSIVGGSSTGAMIAPLAALLGGPPDIASSALDLLIEGYTSMKTSDILERNRFAALVRHRNSLAATEPLRKFIRTHMTQERFDWLQSDEAPLCYVVYTNFTTGNKVAVSPKDPGIDRDRFLDSMLASASVPVYMEPTIIDGDYCFDGGVRDVLPFDEAVRRGADRVVPVFLDPVHLSESPGSYQSLKGVAERAISILLDEVARNDYEQVRMVHLATRFCRRLRSELGWIPRANRIIDGICREEEFAELFRSSTPRLDIIEGIRPDEVITTDALQFDPEKMRQWMAEGEAKAERAVSDNPFLG